MGVRLSGTKTAEEIAEEITARWWDVPGIETRDECVANLAALLLPVLSAERIETVREAAQAVCSYCDEGKRLEEPPKYASGSWWHPDLRIDCLATDIWTLWPEAAPSAGDAEVTGEE